MIVDSIRLAERNLVPGGVVLFERKLAEHSKGLAESSYHVNILTICQGRSLKLSSADGVGRTHAEVPPPDFDYYIKLFRNGQE